jgi:hypothetical protein
MRVCIIVGIGDDGGLKEGTERAMHTLTQHSEEWGILASGSILFLLSFGPIRLARDILSSAVFFLFFIVVSRAGDLCGRKGGILWVLSFSTVIIIIISEFFCLLCFAGGDVYGSHGRFFPARAAQHFTRGQAAIDMVTMVRRLSALHTAAGRPTGAVYS